MKKMTDFIAFLTKHKIPAIITLIVIIGGGIGIHRIFNPSLQSILNSIQYTPKGYEGDGYVELDKSTSNTKKLKKLYESMALLEAKRANFDTGVVKRVFDNEKDPELALKNFKDQNSDIYSAKSSTDISQNNAFYTRMTAIEAISDGSDSKNGDTAIIGFKDTSSDPAFKPFSRKIKISGLKKKKHLTVKVSDFEIILDKSKYDKAYAKALKIEQASKRKKDSDPFDWYIGVPSDNAKRSMPSPRYFSIYYKDKKIESMSKLSDYQLDSKNTNDVLIDVKNVIIPGNVLLNIADPHYYKNKENYSTIYSLDETKDYKVSIKK